MAHFGYDPEATIQDADIETGQLADLGNQTSDFHRRGICTHGGVKLNSRGLLACIQCGAQFKSHQEWIAAVERIFAGDPDERQSV